MFQLPPQDRQYMWNIFASVDTNRSGTIEVRELQRALSAGNWRPFNLETCRMLINISDRDGNGMITFNEFERLWRFLSVWMQAFAAADRNRSWTIDYHELRGVMQGFGFRLTNYFYDMLMRRFDRSRMHQIQIDDFIQLCCVLQSLTFVFSQADTNRNGIIQVNYEQFAAMIFQLGFLFGKKGV